MPINKTDAVAAPRLELGAAVMEYVLDENQMVGTKVFPIFTTPKKKASFPAVTREGLTRETNGTRAPRGDYQRDAVDAKDKSYSCKEWGLEGPLDDSERGLWKSEFDAEFSIVKGITNKILLAQEKRIGDILFNATTFTGASLYTDNSGSPWSTVGTDIIGQVDAAKDKVRTNTGVIPNTLVFSWTNFRRIKSNTAIKDAIKYTARTGEQEILNALADLFGVKKVLVAAGVRNSAKHGQAFAGADIWSANYAMVCVTADDPKDLSQPCIGRTFLWEEDSPENVVVESYREEKIRSDVFRVRQHTDEVLIDTYFGHLMKVA